MKRVKSLFKSHSTWASSVRVGASWNLAMEFSVQGVTPNGQRFVKGQTTRGITEDPTIPPAPVRVLAVASGGGHWHELLRLRPALEGCEQYFVGLNKEYAVSVAPHPFYSVPDAHFDEPFRIICTFFRLIPIFWKIRPHVVLSTGAAPGGLSMLLGRIFRARTLWVESAANCVVQSRTGRLCKHIAGISFVQWPELARSEGPFYRGNIL